MQIDSLKTKCDELLKSEQYEKIITLCDDSLKLDFQNSIALINKGYALGRMGRYHEAIDCCNIVLKIKNDDKNTLELIKWINEESEKIKN